MDQNSILSIIALVVSIGGTFLSIINHRHVISRCCGRKLDFSLDINNTTPPPPPPFLTPTNQP